MNENYQQNYQQNYNQNFQNSDPYFGERKGLSTASIILGIASLPFSYCTGIIGGIFGLLGLLFGIFSKGEARRLSTKAVVGIITGAVGTVFGIFMFIFSLKYMSENWGDLSTLLEEYQNFFNR